ncbi:unnamed protein product [Hyaloperonospora brassicae]|uniref:Zinc finger CHCC-type domain-containing protein n=1 Tax=Hyaloperonospora brassicae TaxID=162125 RepID=A0AAV0TQU1_HYABA|nr:unnamed protein product [Hyaloperonospora brassicae]
MLRRSSQALLSSVARARGPRSPASTPYEDQNRHRSDAELRIAKVPVVEVAASVAVCDGGGGALGHPVEYIQLDTRTQNSPQTCKYCGVRYKMKEGYHGGH